MSSLINNNFNNDTMTILNYQGSKKQLLDFIYNKSVEYIDENKAFMDIFSGSSAVGYAMKRNFQIYSNDSELYSYNIAKALVENNTRLEIAPLFNNVRMNYNNNYENLYEIFGKYLDEEQLLINNKNEEELVNFYKRYPCIWNKETEFKLFNGRIKTISDIQNYKSNIPFMLFTTYYANTYFGVQQSFDIDCIRYAIEVEQNEIIKSVLFSALFFAMKECVFSKDGHMAQPLDKDKNSSKLLKIRSRSIMEKFEEKLLEFGTDDFVISDKKNKTFNLDFNDLLKDKNTLNDLGFIYADPPYTDMQYSRYYHLLNTLVLYDYPQISLTRGVLSNGLYREGRFQSDLSKKSKATEQINELFRACKENKINIGLSFAYPQDPINQPTNRYTMDISKIIEIAELYYGKKNVKVEGLDYEHANNRNSSSKKVIEYLILGIN